jgi:hypothetical protein
MLFFEVLVIFYCLKKFSPRVHPNPPLNPNPNNPPAVDEESKHQYELLEMGDGNDSDNGHHQTIDEAKDIETF